MIGADVRATDGDVGHVDDLVVNDADWTVRGLVIDTRNWIPGRKVFATPGDIRETNGIDDMVSLQLSRRDVRTSPEFAPGSPEGDDWWVDG